MEVNYGMVREVGERCSLNRSNDKLRREFTDSGIRDVCRTARCIHCRISLDARDHFTSTVVTYPVVVIQILSVNE